MNFIEIFVVAIVIAIVLFSRREILAKIYYFFSKLQIMELKVERCCCPYKRHVIGDCYKVIRGGIDTQIILHMGFKLEQGRFDYTAKCRAMSTKGNKQWYGSSLHWGAVYVGDQPDMVIEGSIGKHTALVAAARIISSPKWVEISEKGSFEFQNGEIIKDDEWPKLFNRLLNIKEKALRVESPEEVEFYIQQYTSILEGKEDYSTTLSTLGSYKHFLESNQR